MTATHSGPGQADYTVRALILSNIVTLIIALVQGWSLAPLLFVYWTQSVIIGLFHIRRMLDLEEFTTAGLKMNGRPVAATPKAKRQIAGFFALHYGFFHLVYLVFVLTAVGYAELSSYAWWGLLGGAAVFALNHQFSYLQNRELDRRGQPNLGTMLFLPYARVLPMHLMIVFGAALGVERIALAFFIALKTIADVTMHVVEHRALRKLPDSVPGS